MTAKQVSIVDDDQTRVQIDALASAENALRESETRYRQVVENSPVLIATWHRQILVFINQIGARLLGFESPEQLVGKSIQAIVSDKKILELDDYYTHRSGVLDQTPRFHEVTFTRQDGSQIDLAITFSFIGAVEDQLVQVIAQDITERKYIHQSLIRQAALAEVELAINQPHELNEMIERIVRIAAENLSPSGGAGLTLIETYPQTYVTYFCNAEKPDTIQSYRNSIQNSKRVDWIMRNKKPLIIPDVEKYGFDVHQMGRDINFQAFVALPLMVKNEVLGSLYIYDCHPKEYSPEDIEFLTAIANRSALAIAKVHLYQSLQKAKDSAENAAREKAHMLASMSHELRTPLTTVISLSELLADTKLNQTQGEFVNMIQDNASKLLEILNNILDFSRLEESKLALKSQPFLLSTVLEDCLTAVAVDASRKKLDLDIRIASDVPEAIVGDDIRLGQVLTNLLTNAVKFTQSGSVIVEVKSVQNGADGDEWKSNRNRLLFSVEDTGIGIPPEKIHLLFSMFSQLISPAAQNTGGAGLGLAICKQLVELMGGEIWAESVGVPGLGSKFCFTIQAESAPLESAQNGKSHLYEVLYSLLASTKDETAGTSGSSAPILKSDESGQILLVDDDPVNRKILRIMLEGMGYSVDTAADGVEALAALDRWSYAVALLDMHMPNLNGLETTKFIREQLKPQQQPYIVILTADTQPETQATACAAGADAFLAKPFNRLHLKEVIQKGFGGRKDFQSNRKESFSNRQSSVNDEILTNLIHTIGEDSQELKNLFELFFQNTAILVEKIHTASRNNDREGLKGSLHALRGNCELFGAERLSRLCKELESRDSTGNNDKGDISADKIEAEYRQVVAILKSKLAKNIS